MNAKILVVEDELGQREALAEVLSRLGYEVQCAANGNEALELMRRSESLPGLILLDLMMPVMDGWEFRAEQRKDRALADVPALRARRYCPKSRPGRGRGLCVQAPPLASLASGTRALLRNNSSAARRDRCQKRMNAVTYEARS